MSSSDRLREVLSFLDRQNVMTLATRGPDGIWAAALYYVNDRFTFYFLSAPETRHVWNLMSEPSVAAAIHEDSVDWRAIKGVQLEARASKIVGAEEAAAIARYALKFPVVRNLVQAPAEIAEAFRAMACFKLETTRLYFTDNSLGLGYRDEIPISEQDR